VGDADNDVLAMSVGCWCKRCQDFHRKIMGKANYASLETGPRVWAVIDSKRQVLETSESLDELTKKWGNEYIYTIIIAQHGTT
jgi:hypothetical protein